MKTESSVGLTLRGMKTESRVELTLRGLVLGVVLTVVFTAANVYFGLKAGLTFSTSIPAVVISMAMLRWLGNTSRSEEHTSELQSRGHLVCRLLLEKKKNTRPVCLPPTVHEHISSRPAVAPPTRVH